MNNVFHKGEQHIQEVMSVTNQANTLSSMIQNSIPNIASKFLEALRFCVVSLNISANNLFTCVIYNQDSFIEVLDNKTITVDLKYSSHIPEIFFQEKNLNIGMIGLDFSSAKRIRINGTAKICDDKIIININEIYSNCPKYIKRRVLKSNYELLGKQRIHSQDKIDNELTKIISKSDEFFLSSSHKEKGLDVSYKGGEKGFITVLNSNQLQFDDLPGNNLYNSLGNIHTNEYINMFFIDYKNHNTYNIRGKATIKEVYLEKKKVLRIHIDCINISINLNSFSLNYQ